MNPASVSTVFIIDDDRGMRQSIEDLVQSARHTLPIFDNYWWYADAFGKGL